MPVINGITIEQIVSTVANDDATINTEIAAKGEDNWLLSSLTVSSSDIILLFTKQTTVAP